MIDRQHIGLFDSANGLLGAILSEAGTDEIAGRIDRLLSEIVRHFRDEEDMLRSVGYPNAGEHGAIHRRLIEQAQDLANSLRARTVDVGELFQFLTFEVIARHMLSADRDFFSYLPTGAVGAQAGMSVPITHN